MVIFFWTPPYFVHFGNYVIPTKYEKNEKSLGGATGPQSFVHKVNGLFGQNFQTLILGPKMFTRLAKLSRCQIIKI